VVLFLAEELLHAGAAMPARQVIMEAEAAHHGRQREAHGAVSSERQ